MSTKATTPAKAPAVNRLWQEKDLLITPADKVTRILQSCRDNDLDALTALATSLGGFVDDGTRRTAWPVLLGSVAGLGTIATDEDETWRSLPRHRDEDQVRLDVDRSFVYYPNDQSEKQIQVKKQELSDLITKTLRRRPALCYFQGYHDIVQVFLLVLGVARAPPTVERLSLLRIRDFMLPSLSAAISHLQLLPSILHAADPELCKHIEGTQPFFALAATLTLYAHDIQEYGDIARLFDFLLAHEAVVSIYLYAEIILSRKQELLEIDDDEPEMLHFTLSKLPNPLNLEHLISETVVLFEKYPPESLPFRAWRSISPYSVLKTTRDSRQLARQTLEDGQLFFDKQAAQMRRAQAMQQVMKDTKRLMWVYRRPAGTLSLTILIGLLALWFGKHSAAGNSPWAGSATTWEPTLGTIRAFLRGYR
ncbi:GTPase-activating protein gyp8 [Coniosporium tulheliwenetii]|uniref:GTPase-activating protein gyp8 n=1 Tax=Coniosporium tulheliwenetii TaxID=3383036 RepID=A0ACC2YN51_9PEZI|nr:GTPase-activating protein gyp8 [Cladosporium sp. JES 115]